MEEVVKEEIIQFVSYSDDEYFFRMELNRAESAFFPNVLVSIPNTPKINVDDTFYFRKYLSCSNCKREKEEWIVKNEASLRKQYWKENKSQHMLLTECDSATWIEFANQMLKKRNLTELEKNIIEDLAKKKDLAALGEFVDGLITSKFSKFKSFFKKLFRK